MNYWGCVNKRGSDYPGYIVWITVIVLHMKLHFTGTKRQRGEGSKDLLSLGDDFNDDEEDMSDMDDDSDEVNTHVNGKKNPSRR